MKAPTPAYAVKLAGSASAPLWRSASATALVREAVLISSLSCRSAEDAMSSRRCRASSLPYCGS